MFVGVSLRRYQNSGSADTGRVLLLETVSALSCVPRPYRRRKEGRSWPSAVQIWALHTPCMQDPLGNTSASSPSLPFLSCI